MDNMLTKECIEDMKIFIGMRESILMKHLMDSCNCNQYGNDMTKEVMQSKEYIELIQKFSECDIKMNENNQIIFKGNLVQTDDDVFQVAGEVAKINEVLKAYLNKIYPNINM